jgi:hypothetical protein
MGESEMSSSTSASLGGVRLVADAGMFAKERIVLAGCYSICCHWETLAIPVSTAPPARPLSKEDLAIGWSDIKVSSVLGRKKISKI